MYSQLIFSVEVNDMLSGGKYSFCFFLCLDPFE
jgi:hypothetical protein